MEREVRYCTTEDGVRIAYWTLGSGRPLVLMDMPYSHAEAEWDTPAMRALYEGIARVARLVRYDHRGFGMSDRDVRFELDGFVQDLETVIDSLGLNDFSLVAHRGATASIAITYAVRHPERLSRLVLSIGVIRWPELINQQMNALLETNSDWRFVSESISRLVFGWEDEEASRLTAGLLRDSISLESFKEYWQASTKWDVSGLLREVKIPTLLLHWKDHPIFGQEHSRQLAASIPDAQVVLLDAATSAERGMKSQQAIGAFLGLVVRAAPAATPGARLASGHRQLTTILFTDLVGHTEMMQRLGDEGGREVLRDHERITRRVLKQHGGVEVKTDGDSFMVSFASVTAALECAVGLQRVFAKHNETATEPILVRMGLNAGEPIEEDGDLFGATVILASRIAAKADGGEILVADTVRGLCSGKGFLFADRGEFVAKGFEEPVRMYEVSWELTNPGLLIP